MKHGILIGPRGRIRSATIGSAGDMTLPEVRAEARELIASFVEPARKGNGRRGPSAGSPATAFFAFDKCTFSTRLSGRCPGNAAFPRVFLMLGSRTYAEGIFEQKANAIVDKIQFVHTVQTSVFATS